MLVPLWCNAQKSDPNDWSDALVKWDTQCSPKGCLLMTDVLRGDSGNPPNPKDFREYIGIYVAVDRDTQKPAYFAFHVDPAEQLGDGGSTVAEVQPAEPSMAAERGVRNVVFDRLADREPLFLAVFAQEPETLPDAGRG